MNVTQVTPPPVVLAVCVWREDEDGVWNTSCDNAHTFTTGGPVDNKASFCCYCGKELRAEPLLSDQERLDTLRARFDEWCVLTNWERINDKEPAVKEQLTKAHALIVAALTLMQEMIDA